MTAQTNSKFPLPAKIIFPDLSKCTFYEKLWLYYEKSITTLKVEFILPLYQGNRVCLPVMTWWGQGLPKALAEIPLMLLHYFLGSSVMTFPEVQWVNAHNRELTTPAVRWLILSLLSPDWISSPHWSTPHRKLLSHLRDLMEGKQEQST